MFWDIIQVSGWVLGLIAGMLLATNGIIRGGSTLPLAAIAIGVVGVLTQFAYRRYARPEESQPDV